MKSFYFKLFILLCAFGFSFRIGAATITFPEKELPSEYALPYFKNPKALLNKNVPLTGRFIFYGAYSFRTDEPLFFKHSFQAGMGLFWSESHGLGIGALFLPQGLSPTGRKLKGQGIADEQGDLTSSYFDAELAPNPRLALFLNYLFAPLYGKMSISKTVALNFALYSVFGLGVMNMQQKDNSVTQWLVMPAGHIGLGKRIYFNSYLALDFGVDFLAYQGFNPVSRYSLRPARTADSKVKIPSPVVFKKEIFLRFLFTGGLILLF